MKTAPARIALIGLGAIGLEVVRLIHGQTAGRLEVVGALVQDRTRPRPSWTPPAVASLADLLARDPEAVVEVGGHAALARYGPAVLRARTDLVIVSVGALARRDLLDAITEAARVGDSHACIVSGAIGGLDALAAAAVDGLERVTHTTRKPAAALLPAAEAARLTRAHEIFRGNAREAALRYPESVNVAAAVSLAGLGFERTEVRVLADPHIAVNHHEVLAEGAFGAFRFEIRNIPSETNPRTSRIVAASVVKTLLARTSSLTIG